MSRRLGSIVLALALLAALLTPAAEGQVSSAQMTGIEMTPPVRRALKQLEDQWLQWVVKNNPEASNRVVDDLLATAQQLGMTRLPDLSIGALARAVQAARQGDFARARWSLAAAERLDPGRPEIAFAAATVERLAGRYPAAFVALLRGYARMSGLSIERTLWLQNLLVWSLSLLLLTGALFIALQMVTKGGPLWRDLVGFLSRRLPGPAAVLVAVVLLLWPVVLPSGPLWLPLYWSVLLWAYCSVSERVVLVLLWILVGVSPVLVGSQSRRTAVMLSPPAQAMESLEQRRLYGSLFSDLGALRSLLPESPAVKHLLADVHRSLNQWELASTLYRQVLEQEPENTAAQIDLGAHAFLKGDFGTAIQHFQKVATSDPASAAAQFNLSQAYSESYLFDESKRALAQARQIDNSRVDGWMRDVAQQRVVTMNGGMARIPEIRRELLAAYHTQQAPSPVLEQVRKGLPLAVPVGLALLTLGLYTARRPFRQAEKPEPVIYRPFGRWQRVLLPGLTSAEAGEGLRSFLALLLPVALLMLPLFGGLGYRIPWGYDPGNLTAWILAILGLSLYVGMRLRWELRNEV
jgi:tetratricopeptide (TPR) repeat protein